MRAVRSILSLATLAVAVTACSVNDGYYAPRPQATYYPATTTTTYYGTPAATTYYGAPVTTYDPPSYQKSNVYSSRADYYRNYQGIHDGPERTGP